MASEFNNNMEPITTSEFREIESSTVEKKTKPSIISNESIDLEPQEIQETRDIYKDRIRLTGNPDGTTTAEFNIKPVFYIDAQGTQQIIDTTIERAAIDNVFDDSKAIETYQYQSIKNNLKLYFNHYYSPEISSNIIFLNDKSNEYPITWQPLGLMSSEQNNDRLVKNTDELDTYINFKSSGSIVEENKISYKNIYPGCDDSYSVLPNKLKHNFILNKHPLDASNQLNTELLTLNYFGIMSLPSSLIPYIDDTPYTEAFETSKLIELRAKDTGKPIYCIQEPFAYEQQRPENRIKCSYEYIPIYDESSNEIFGPELLGSELKQNLDEPSERTQILLILKTDLAWLQAPERKYPIIIDPDIETPDWKKGEVGYDTYLVQGNETEPEWNDYNFGTSSELKVSLAGPSRYSEKNLLYRSILRFPGINTIKSHAQIIEAKLILQCKNEGNMSISVFKLFDNWIEGAGTEDEPGSSGATWNNSGYNMWLGGNFDGDITTHSTILVKSSFYYTWDIKDIVEDWVADPIGNPNYGLILTGTDKEDTIKVFHSSEVANPDMRPKIIIEYNTPPTFLGLNQIDLPEDEEIEIERTKIFYDPDVDDPDSGHEDEIYFELWNGSAWTKQGTYKNETFNFSVALTIHDKLLINTLEEKQQFGSGPIKVRVKDLNSPSWLEEEIIINAFETNDQPIIRHIDNKEVDDEMVDYKMVELDASEGEASVYEIDVYDPDNPSFEEIATPEEGIPGDLEFRWEKDMPGKFFITSDEDPARIVFNPDNSLVGTFYMNITVYDTEWYKPTKYARIRKRELSNDSVMLIINIENKNNPPEKPKILEPKDNSQFSAEEFITFRGYCFDIDFLIPESKEKLRYIWVVGEDTILGEGKDIKEKLSKGTHLITLRVVDSANAFSEVNITISIRNRATIDELNCSNHFIDETEDVLGFFYQCTDEGEEDFRVERSSFGKYNIFDIDLKEITSQRFGQLLLINLTINQNISDIFEIENIKYDFSVYLVKPRHKEDAQNLEGVRYLGNRYSELYKPTEYYSKITFDDKYYKNNGLGEFRIVNRGQTLSMRPHLGDLEAGIDNPLKLKSDFSVFAILKIEIEQHPIGCFEHIICYDSIGHGAAVAPFPKQPQAASDSEGLGPSEIMLIAIIVIIIIMMILISIIIFRRVTKEEEAESSIIYDTTKGETEQKPIPVGPMFPGPGPGFPMHPPGMPGMLMPGRMQLPPQSLGGPMSMPPRLPLLPPPKLPITGPPGKIKPIAPETKSKKDKKKKK